MAKIINCVSASKLESRPGEPEFRVTHYHWRDICSRLRRMLAPHWRKILVATICVALVGMAVAAVPLFPKYVIDTAIGEHKLHLAAVAAVLFILSQFSRMGLWYLAMRNVYQVQQMVVFQLRADAFRHLQHLCLRFHSQYPSGFLYERVFGNSINSLGTFIQIFMQQFSNQITGLFFSLFVCLYLSPPLTLVIIVGATGYVFAARRLSPRIYQRNQASAQAGMRVTEIIMDKLHGQKTIQAHAMEDRVQDEFEQQIWDAQRKWLAGVMESMKLGFVTEGIGYLLTAIIVFGGAVIVMYFHQPLGVLVAFVGYQGTLIGIIQSLTNVYGQFTAARVAFDQLFTVLDTHSEVEDAPDAAMPPEVQGGIEFEHVDFGYRPDQVVLHDLSFSLPAGRTVALVGRSGCGKTTVTNLIMRFYDPLKGSIKLDGHDLRTLPLHDYRSLFGVVLQDPYLFDTTIYENLHCANPQATEEEMRDALERARAWEFVRDLPGLWLGRVGEGGTRLSGGQRQRLAIARCLLLPSRIVILDEATSALDAESEAMIQQSFESLSRNKTVLIIAHRLNTLKRADSIVVMDRGRVVEQGSYDELLARRGLFYELNEIATAGMVREARMAEAGFA